jgi:hypothetical protein
MWRARRNQRDPFDETPQVAELRPDLRNKLSALLQALLAEAAGVQQHRTESLIGGEAGDDQDHA